MEEKNKGMVLGYSTRAEPGQDQEIASCTSIYSHPNCAMVGRAAATYCRYKVGLTYIQSWVSGFWGFRTPPVPLLHSHDSGTLLCLTHTLSYSSGTAH